jgi:hypothetical protein
MLQNIPSSDPCDEGGKDERPNQATKDQATKDQEAQSTEHKAL